jgi:hypothetical protein
MLINGIYGEKLERNLLVLKIVGTFVHWEALDAACTTP